MEKWGLRDIPVVPAPLVVLGTGFEPHRPFSFKNPPEGVHLDSENAVTRFD